MNVSIEFPTEVENALLRSAAAVGQDVAAFIKEVVTERLSQEGATETPRLVSHGEFMDNLRTIIDLHPVSNWPVDDSRESIYAGRGELDSCSQ